MNDTFDRETALFMLAEAKRALAAFLAWEQIYSADAEEDCISGECDLCPVVEQARAALALIDDSSATLVGEEEE